MAEENHPQDDAAQREVEAGGGASGRLSTIGWGLFVIWVGVAMLADLDVGIALLGIGIITLGIQVARLSIGLALEGFWVVLGLLFVVGAIWQLMAVDLPLVPVLLIGAGVALLLASFWGGKSG